MSDLAQQFRDDRDLHLRQAKRYLSAIQKEAAEMLGNLEQDPPSVPADVGGAVLGHQAWEGAERALVRYRDAAATVAVLEREESASTESRRRSLRVVGGKRDVPGGGLVKAPEDLFEEVATGFVSNREPGSVAEDEFQQKLEDVRRAWWYLQNESVWRVELDRVPDGPHRSRIQYREAVSAGDAASGWTVPGKNRRRPPGVISARRATTDDLREYLESD